MASINPWTQTLWLVFLALWVVASLATRQNVRNWALWRGIGFRAALVCGTVLLFDIPVIGRYALSLQEALTLGTSALAVNVGIALCAFGLSIALWARVYLRGNWGVPMSLRPHHELVTSGPYRFLRHPIYAGILIALFGSGLAEGIVSMTIFVVFCGYFWYSARVEDRMLAEQFPGSYDRYAKRTKMLVPHVL